VDFFAGQAGVGRVREFSVLVENNEFPRSSIGFYLAPLLRRVILVGEAAFGGRLLLLGQRAGRLTAWRAALSSGQSMISGGVSMSPTSVIYSIRYCGMSLPPKGRAAPLSSKSKGGPNRGRRSDQPRLLANARRPYEMQKGPADILSAGPAEREAISENPATWPRL
jgi:hypothetical protein